MIVNNLCVERFGGVERLQSVFDPQFTVLPQEDAGTIRTVLGIALKSRVIAGPEARLNENATIRAEFEIGGRTFRVTVRGSSGTDEAVHTVETEEGRPFSGFYDMIHQCAEEESLSLYDPGRNDDFSERFQRYGNAREFYKGDSFFKLTDGIGTTKWFRSYLDKHLKQRSLAAGERRIAADGRGELVPAAGACANEGIETDDMPFDYLCYLEIDRFWQALEAVRDPHHVRWPLFLAGLRRADGAVPPVGQALPPGRQVFVC